MQASSALTKILFVSPSYYVLSGMATWLDYLLPGLANRGWIPVLGLVSGHHHDVDRYLEVHPWPDTVRIANPTGSVEGRIRAVEQVIRHIAPDLVVSVNIPVCYAAVERLRRGRNLAATRVVMTNHSVEAGYIAEAQAWSHVIDGMIGTNRLIAIMAREFTNLDPRRLLYAPCGTELPSVSPSKGGRRADSKLRIAYSGRLEEEQKRVQDLSLILRALKARGVAYDFRIAGSGSYEGQLRQELSEGVDAGYVHFMGRLDPDELNRELYAWADVLLVTSCWETGPLVIWEAMAHRVAVVSSRYVGSGREGSLRDDENCLLFPVGDIRAAAQQLARLTDISLRDRLANAGYALVAEHYTCNCSIEAWARAYQAVLGLPVPDLGEQQTPVPPSGRLDRLLGTHLGETVRRGLGIRFEHADPGGEWPHALSGAPIDPAQFWERMCALDQTDLVGAKSS